MFMDTEHFYGLIIGFHCSGFSRVVCLWLVQGGLTVITGTGRHNLAHGTDQGICAGLSGEESAPMGVHVVCRVQQHSHLDDLFRIDAEIAVGVPALDPVAGVARLALALEQLPPLPHLLIENALGIWVAGRGDVITVSHHAVAILTVATVDAVVAFLGVEACSFIGPALVTRVGAQRTL